MIRLRTLGECVIEIDGTGYGPDCDALFAGLVFLTAERGRKVSRLQLAALLWPRLPAERGRHNLRQLVYRMRMAGVPVESGRESLTLPDRLVAPTFSAAPAPERLVAERIAGTLRIGAFLPGYWPTFSDPFADWVERARATTEARVRRVLLEVAQAHKLRGEWEEVDALASECLRLDPLNEEATLARAEATAMLGEKHEALAILDRYREELGPARAHLQLPATVLRRRIAERFPARRFGGPSDRCFVGRAELMQTLSTAVLRARHGEGSAALLVGAPGIGKTRVVQELSRAAVMQGVRVVRVAVDEADLQRPMAAFAGAVPQLRALPGAIGVSPEGLAFLDRLTEAVPAPGTVPEETRDPRWLAGRIRQSVVDLCDAVAGEGTLLLAVEDVHWLDASSWATLDALLEWLPTKRMLLVLTSRGPHPTANTPRRCVERLAVHPVTALAPDAGHAFARAIATDHGGPLSDSARAWCVEVGEGNPLFLRELVVHCLEGGMTHAVPPSLHGLLDARIARLGATARQVLDAAAVLGDLTTVERLAQMLELQAHQLAGALAELAEGLLLDEMSASVALRHELVSARVMERMAGPVRRLMHRRAARVLELDGDSDTTAELRLAAAAHWKAAGDESRAIASLSGAAEAVERLGAVPESIRLVDAALALAPVGPIRGDLLGRLCRALALDGQWSRAAEIATGLADSLDPVPDKNSIAGYALLGIRAAHFTEVDPHELCRESFALASDADVHPTHRLAAARTGMGIAASLADQTAVRDLWNAVEELVGADSTSNPEALEVEVVYQGSAGSMARALECAVKLRSMADAESDALRRLSWLVTVAEAHRAAGFWDVALSHNKHLLEEACREGSRHFELRALQRIANILIESGDPNGAVPWLERAASAMADRMSHWYRESLLEDQARIALFERRFDDARELTTALRESCDRARYRSVWYDRVGHTLAIELQLLASNDPVAPGDLQRLEQIHASAQWLPIHDRTAAVLVLALERANRKAEATHLVAEYLRSHRRALAPWRDPRIQIGLLASYRVPPNQIPE